ncbi:MAG TPA: glycosyltransferase family 39 protein [Candidatus Polarisedimenticolaceae bacterium]|nr:glycosyltransferase family 39 protein [Candidatus Polarisedimenticolaceae bacterium]
MSASSLLPSPQDRARGVWSWVVLAGLLVLAAAPRLYDLGNPGLLGNEDYAAIAARAIREEGVPRFPSGVIYPRALLFSYLTAASTSLLGATALATRLPAALLSLLTVALTYLFGRRAFGRQVALLAALFLALSSWEIATARTARMYAPFSAVYLFALFGMYKVAFEDDDRFRLPTLAATVVACSLHQLGAVLAVPYAVLFLLRRHVRRQGFVALALAAVVLAGGAQILFERHHYAAFEQRVTTLHAPSDAGGGAASDPEEEGAPLLERGRWMALALFGAGLAGALALRGRRASFLAALATAVLLSGMQQLALAFYAAAAFLAWHAFAHGRWHWREVSILFGVLAVGAAAWLAVLVAGPAHLSPVRALRAMAGFPPNFLEYFARRGPAPLALAAVGTGVILTSFFRQRRAFAPHVFVVAAFALSATALGFSPRAWTKIDERYVFHLDPYFALLFAAGAWWLGTRAAAAFLPGGERAPLRRALSGCLGLLLMVIPGGIWPPTTLAATVQHYGKNERLRRSGEPDSFVPDHAGSSGYVCSHAATGDFIVPMDLLIHDAYCPRADIQLTMSHKGDAEGWIGLRSVHTLRDVGLALEKTEAPQVWIVLSGQAINYYGEEQASALSAATAFTTWDCARRVYAGRDGLSDVWVVPRECFLRRALR